MRERPSYAICMDGRFCYAVEVMISKLPPKFQRNFRVNSAIFIAFIVLCIVAFRLGLQRPVPVIMVVLLLGSGYFCYFCTKRAFRTTPRLGAGAFVHLGAGAATFIYAGLHWVFPGLPYTTFSLIASVILNMGFLAAYPFVADPFFNGEIASAVAEASRVTTAERREQEKQERESGSA